MKVSKMTKGLWLGLALLLATSAFASKKGSLQLSQAVNVNGKQLPAGDYTVKWHGSGTNVQASIMKGKNVVATVPARLVDLDRTPGRDASVLRFAFQAKSLPWRLAKRHLKLSRAKPVSRIGV